ncbi:right-handed parallel beta-helix repeat-containing protein [Paenibacillus sp. KQZ6P-2]|uniref:Right-handed parallel beta-helix repeat-containing protein n=1 Tax=Paenibacillus mangrovi TaxID=2931978 RepID=A0A9X1WQA7_9BACL|nr:right-handed parallel beta-helix repeat-containing protein [Paenibacillus mangrovi]MCJ8011995.1 right-handed parallel beta-helix repeat-containing protein [Paenibacillus mangrovi]
MSQEFESPQQEPTSERKISRRKLLAGIGMAGAAAWMTANTGIVSAQEPSVTDATYGEQSVKPIDLMNLSYCITTTINELRLHSQVNPSFGYYVTDPGQEGMFLIDLSDTVTADNVGTVLVHQSGTRFKRVIENHTVNAAWYGAKGDNLADDTDAIQAALNEANRWPNVRVIIPNGTYRLSRELYIFKNTYIQMDEGTVLLRCHDGNVIRNYRTTDLFYGYEGNGNITIEGGVLDCNAVQYTRVCNGIALAHAENITLRKLTIKDTQSGHGAELTGVRRVLIDRCKFVGYMFTTQYYAEAIQLEPAIKAGFVGQAADHTPTHHVTVQQCYFGPSGTPGTVPWPCGVGAHGAYPDAYFDHIIVRDNVMENSTYWAIRPFKWTNSVIAGNHMIQVGGGIFISTPAANSASSKDDDGVFHPVQPASTIIVEHNIFDTGTTNAIYVEGFPEGNGEKVVIANNIFKNSGGQAISLHSNRTIVTGNIFEGATKNGIYLTDCNDVIITDNLIRDVAFNGIQVNNSKGVIADGNSITNAGQSSDNSYDGIYVSGTSSNVRVIGNVVRTEAGKKKLRYGLNTASTVTALTRLQNDLRCDAISGNLHDLSVNPNTSYADMV